MSALKILNNATIKRFEKIEDYYHILFSDGNILNIFNNISYSSDFEFEGKKVESVSELKEKIIILIDGGSALIIGMTDNDYNGPEALALKCKNKPDIVWN